MKISTNKKPFLYPVYLSFASAILYSASIPATKLLVAQVNPQMLAGLLYLGSGIGLAIYYRVAGLFNCSIAWAFGSKFPGLSLTLVSTLIGFLGFGVSLVLYLKAMRYLGAARTSAYFATAPFVGAAISILFMGQPLTTNFIIAAALMMLGVWLNLTRIHEHHQV